MITHGSLFSGIDGFSLGAHWAGWQNAFHCEINPFGRRVLEYWWPNAKTYEDITTTDFTIWHGRIDVLTGGFPCQPFSQAGKREGTADERHLWPEMLRAIREIAPRWVVGENVRGLVNWSDGMVFEQVCADLEVEGYEVQPFLLPAAGVGAPHQRYRVWFVAYRNIGNRQKNRFQTGRKVDMDGDERTRASSYAPMLRCEGIIPKRQGVQWQDEACREAGASCDANAPDACHERLQGRQLHETSQKGRTKRERESKAQSHQAAAQLHQVAYWQNFPTQPPICGGDDGLPAELDGITFSKWRNESIKAYGNAIVPQVFLQIAESINAYEALIPHNPQPTPRP